MAPIASRPAYEPQKALGEAVRALRMNLMGMNQKDFAQSIDMSPSWLSRIESGDYDPSIGNMRRIAAGLSISLGELIEAADSFE